MSAQALIAVAAGCLVMALPVVAGAAALEAEQRAAGTADAAALAAADALLGWVEGDPCGLAAQLAETAAVALEQCSIDAAGGQVRVRMSVQTMFGTVQASAKAGPPVA